MFMDYWDPDTKDFQLDMMPLRLEVEDIYFITGLSRRGKVVNLRDCGVGGGMTIDGYIAVYFVKKVGIQVPINVIQSLSIKVIILVLGRIVRWHHYDRNHDLSCSM